MSQLRPSIGVLRTDSDAFIAELRRVVGARYLLTGHRATRHFRTGFRCGAGKAEAVVLPGSLLEQWHVLEACVRANRIMIIQASNTGLTGGSTPDGDIYDRELVVVNMTRMKGLFLINEGRQVICLPGTTLHELESALDPIGREPHSVIGSSCLGASVVGGICNNSGGALVRRGPAYTELALFARIGPDGLLKVTNHLGIELGTTPKEILRRLERGDFSEAAVECDISRVASDRSYGEQVRDVDAATPARFNANPGRLHEAAGCAGRIAVFAVRLDTFPKDDTTAVFYIGTRSPQELTNLRRHILQQFENLPVAGEYLHRHLFDVASVYGKDQFLTIALLGTRRLAGFLRLKRALDRLLPIDGLLTRLVQWIPSHLPRRMRHFRDHFEHHLLLKMSGGGVDEARNYLKCTFPSSSGDYFECTETEATKAFLHRFVAAGSAMRYGDLQPDKVEDLLSLDIALRRNDQEWSEVLRSEVQGDVHLALYYGHFFCHVFHRDYLVKKGCDVEALKKKLLKLLDKRGAEYPAEHNVGHFYRAKPALEAHYRKLDPCNQFNPGIGRTSKLANWGSTGS